MSPDDSRFPEQPVSTRNLQSGEDQRDLYSGEINRPPDPPLAAPKEEDANDSA